MQEVTSLELDTNTFETYAEILSENNETLKDNEVLSKKVALAHMRLNKGLTTLVDSWEDISKVLSKAERNSVEYAEAVGQLRNSFEEMFDYNTGRWIKVSEVRKQFENIKFKSYNYIRFCMTYLDIKLMFLFGLVIGYGMSVCTIFLATFIAFPIALFLLISKKDNIIPFGPFLSMSAILLFIWGLNFTDIINFIINQI